MTPFKQSLRAAPLDHFPREEQDALNSFQDHTASHFESPPPLSIAPLLSEKGSPVSEFASRVLAPATGPRLSQDLRRQPSDACTRLTRIEQLTARLVYVLPPQHVPEAGVRPTC